MQHATHSAERAIERERERERREREKQSPLSERGEREKQRSPEKPPSLRLCFRPRSIKIHPSVRSPSFCSLQ